MENNKPEKGKTSIVKLIVKILTYALTAIGSYIAGGSL